MSTANPHDTRDPNSLLYYAPRRLRDRANALRSIQQRPEDGAQSITTASLEGQTSAALGQKNQNTTPQPGPFPESLLPLEPEAIESLSRLSQRARINEIFAIVTRFAAVASIAAGISFLYVVNFTGSRDQGSPVKGDGISVSTMSQSQPPHTDQSPQRTLPPKTVLADADANISEPPPLETEVITARPVATVSFPASAANAFVSVDSPGLGNVRQMDSTEIAALIKRGEKLLSAGDISAARLLLQRAAEAHDARAALELASTYDPMMIGQFGRNGVGSDIVLARVWYERARDWGSPDAPRQLEALANAHR